MTTDTGRRTLPSRRLTPLSARDSALPAAEQANPAHDTMQHSQHKTGATSGSGDFTGRHLADSVLPTLVACHECDLLHRKRDLQQGQVARCGRCNAFLYANKPNSIDRALAVSLGALIMFMVANAFPFLAISVSGNTQSISIISAVFALSDEGMWVLGLLCFGFILLIPLLRVVGLLYILLPLRFERRLPGIEMVFRGIVALSPWSMMEIYMFGAIVALVKLATMANIELGLSFWAFALLNLLSLLAAQMVDNHSLWEFIIQSRGHNAGSADNARDSDD
jgi:paraquat-inducible protein A